MMRGIVDSIPVMIVEDHAVMRKGLSALLRETSARVVAETADPDSALKEALRVGPAVVLIDQDEGIQPAFDSIAALRRVLPSARVIVLSDRASLDGVKQALRSGASGYLLKAISRNELVLAIENVARGGTVIAPTALTDLVQTITGQQLGPSRADRTLLDRLNERDLQILKEAAQGRTNAEIAASTCFSVGTIKNRLADIYRRIGVVNRAEAAYFATRAGIVK